MSTRSDVSTHHRTNGRQLIDDGRDVSWMRRALCANTPGLTDEAFFPERGESTREAKAVCAQCPVREACLEYGLGERFGIWGGMSERQRQRVRRQRRQQRRAA